MGATEGIFLLFPMRLASITSHPPAQLHFPLADGPWLEVRDGHDDARALFDRHYSRRRYGDGRFSRLFVGPGEKLVLITPGCDALFVWRRFISDDGQRGVNCAVFRNESGRLSSDLIRGAVRAAWRRWPGERLYTYVNPARVRSANPGYCFKRAGWRLSGRSAGGLHILSLRPAAVGLRKAA